jgi:protein-S-isoprenylcysteine O-methyltransferase Ste14
MSIFKLIGGVIFDVALFGGLLFLPAGTLDWWRAWVFVGVVCFGAAASIASLARAKDGLLEERFKLPIQKGQPLVDKILLILLISAYLGLIALIPLDVFRFHLTAKPGPSVSSLGLVLFVLGWWIMTLALRENPFASAVVRHQKERHQTVIDTGVYGVVRHPMYASAIPLLIGMPLWLESYAATILAIIPIGMLIVRIFVEEKFLKQELAGYGAYTERVRHRLIPFVW